MVSRCRETRRDFLCCRCDAALERNGTPPASARRWVHAAIVAKRKAFVATTRHLPRGSRARSRVGTGIIGGRLGGAAVRQAIEKTAAQFGAPPSSFVRLTNRTERHSTCRPGGHSRASR